MCSKILVLALIAICSVVAQKQPLKRQVGTTTVEKDEDHVPAETGFLGANHATAGSKYFQYIHVPAKDHYEHGHRRGNEHHFIERHEKAHPHAGEFKTKVRWGDKHGGYGEHYWDYNHAGHGHDGDGEESQQNEEYANYEETKASPTYHVDESAKLSSPQRGKREPEHPDVEFVDTKARSLLLDGSAPRHGGNYRREGDYRRKRSHHEPQLVYQPDLGRIVDTITGVQYKLKAIKEN